MPKLENDQLTLCLDMAGCPNRCRHCWMAQNANVQMPFSAMQDVYDLFRPFIKTLGISSWCREPDYRDDYKALWEEEKRLSDEGMAKRFELLSTWRLARDEGYAPWSYEMGTRICQITFFGLEASTDVFMGRKGGFRDQITATQRCLAAGIVPRWQIFPFKNNLDELDGLLQLAQDMHLEKRCMQLGSHFTIFCNSSSPEGAGYELESLRLNKADLRRIPESLRESSFIHYRTKEIQDFMGIPESVLYDELQNENDSPNASSSFPAFFITPKGDVFSNLYEQTPWWKLGNLAVDGAQTILSRYENDDTPALQANAHLPLADFVRMFGDPTGEKLYVKSDYIVRLMHQWGMHGAQISKS